MFGAHLADILSGCHLSKAFLYAFRQDVLLMLSGHFPELSWRSIIVSCCANAAMMPAVPPRRAMDRLHYLVSHWHSSIVRASPIRTHWTNKVC